MGQPVDATCAGRTDRGVHALAQVVHVDLDPPDERGRAALADLDVLRERIDRMVGEAITLWSVTGVDTTFDARFSAVWRAYRFRLAELPADPRTRNVVWHVGPQLDVAAMHAAAQHVVGEHDYAAFCRRAPGRHTVRRVDEAAVRRLDDEVHVTLRGAAFCHQMVRSIAGSLVEVGRGRRPPEWLGGVLAGRDRSAAGPVAPPHGLTLEGVGYRAPWPPAPVRSHGGRAAPASG
jgi:tRNA pseudouridine38-40 synthase